MAPLRRATTWLKAHPGAADALLAAVTAAALVPGQWQTPPGSQGITFRDPSPVGVVLALAASVPLAWRRRWPFSTFFVVAMSAMAYEVAGFATVFAPFGLLVALYTVGAHCPRQRSRLAALITAVGLAVVLLTARWDVNAASISSNVIVFATVWLIGDNLRTRRAYVASLQDRAERAERTRAAEAQRAVAEERTRIARELHDVVAHSMSVMVVQAGAARRVLDRNPGQTAEALEAIEATGRQAMTEMRRLLGVLRDSGEGARIRAPQPSMAELRALVEQFADAGLPVTLSVDGDERDLPAGVALSAYRIVQEALTNSLKHAGPAAAVEVRVRYEDDEVVVEVLDDGRGVVAATSSTAGHGLVGMRERVDVCGGELRTGPRAGGGFGVRARLPVTGQAHG